MSDRVRIGHTLTKHDDETLLASLPHRFRPFETMQGQAVADAVAESHAAWLKMPGKGGAEHNDTDMRSLMFDYSHQGIPHRGPGWLDSYQDAWNTIGAASETISRSEISS